MSRITWSNWSGGQTAAPNHFLQPQDTRALQYIVNQHAKIRVVGAGHSFSPVVKTDDTLVSLDHLSGLIDHDPVTHQSQLWAGTRLHQLGALLEPIDQALINQGDIDQQSLAGVVATATHGTGIDLPCLSALVTEFELLTAQGELLQCNAEKNSEIFRLGRVALGSFGIMTKITMQNRPRYKLKEYLALCPLHDVMQHIDTWKYQHRHIEFWAFMHSDQVMLKTLDETDEPIAARQAPFPSDDALLTSCCEITRKAPWANAHLQKLLKIFVKPTSATDWSDRIFPTPRNTKFNEMEYQLPVAQGLACLEEMIWAVKKAKVPMFFPFEFRYVKGDDIALSPFYQRDSVSISTHHYHKQDYKAVFNLVEPILQRYQGRPHWGKLHSMHAKQLSAHYPKWDDFLQLRQQLDPQQKWLNPHLQRLFIQK